jgi:hypothetical protein
VETGAGVTARPLRALPSSRHSGGCRNPAIPAISGTSPRRKPGAGVRLPWIPACAGMTEGAHVDLARHRGGDEGGAEFLEVVDGLADLGR